MNEEEFLVWVERYLDGSLGPVERQSLRQAVLSSPRLRALFTEQVRAGLELSALLKSDEAEEAWLRAEMILSVDSEARDIEVARSLEARLGIRLSREGGVKTTRVLKRATLRQRAPMPRSAYWRAGVAAAGFVVSLVALLLASHGGPFVLDGPPTAARPADGPPARAESGRKAETVAPKAAPTGAAPAEAAVPGRSLEPRRPAEEKRPPVARTDPERKAPERRAVNAGPAKIQRLHGEVHVLGIVKKAVARNGTELMAEQGLDVGGLGSRATLRLADGTRLELDPETTLTRVSGPRHPDLGGRRVEMSRGVLVAEVAPDGPVTIGTPNVDISIPRGSVRVVLEAGATRVEVRQGRAELAGVSGARPVEVGPGQFALAAAGEEPRPRAFHEVVVPVTVCAVEAGTAATPVPAVPSPAPTFAVLLKWDVSAVPAGSRVLSAGLTVHTTDKVARGVEAFELKRPWAEAPDAFLARGGVRLNSFVGAKVLGVLMPGRDGEHAIPLGVDGVALIQSWVESPSANHGVVLMDVAKPDQIVTDAPDLPRAPKRPRLTVTFASK
jgi:ferric-dicitrate binding protein FerR (iron transport regulator)